MLNWSDHYDRHNWKDCDQLPLTVEEKEVMELLAVSILKIDSSTARTVWGIAYQPGRHAQTVIHVTAGVRHRFSEHGHCIGLKLFNVGADCPWMGPKMVEFHTKRRHLIPGLPNSYVQKVFDGGFERTAKGIEHGYLIQEWIEGEVLEKKLKAGISRDDLMAIVEDLFLHIIIPLWKVGTAWWDVRDSNYVFTPEKRLIMIDSDTLAADVDEILSCNPTHLQRNEHTKIAMVRYRALIGRLIRSYARSTPGFQMSKNEQIAKTLVTQNLFPAFCSPYPLSPDWERRSTLAYESFKTSLLRALK